MDVANEEKVKETRKNRKEVSQQRLGDKFDKQQTIISRQIGISSCYYGR